MDSKEKLAKLEEKWEKEQSKPVDPRPLELEILNEGKANQINVLNILTPAMREKVIAAMEARPLLFDKDEQDLLKILRKLNAQPTVTDNRLRLAFWREYDDCCANMKTKISLTNCYTGICTQVYYLGVYLERAERVAWLMCPPVSYEMAMEECLVYGVEQLREILALPIVGKDGKVNTPLASLKERIVSRLDERKNGSVVQRSLSVNIGDQLPNDARSDVTLKEKLVSMSMQEIQDRLNRLDVRDRKKAREMEKVVVVDPEPATKVTIDITGDTSGIEV